MALSAKGRRQMAAKNFGLPSARKYPINTAGRARSALARVQVHGTPTQQAQVRARVASKYPSMNVKNAPKR